MRSRKLRWVLAGLTLALLAVGTFVLWPQPIVAGLTQENFDRIQLGMTRPEVEALLGKPSMFDGGGLLVEPPSGILPVTHPDWGLLMWDDPESLLPEHRGTGKSSDSQWFFVNVNAASVSFDTSGKVSSKYSEKFVVRQPLEL